MPPLRYHVAVDPILHGNARAWLVMQDSTDFEGFVIVAKAKTKGEAEQFKKQLELMEQQFFAAQRQKGRVP